VTSLHRINLYVLGAMLIAVAPLGRQALIGVALGGVIAIANLRMLERGVTRLLGGPAPNGLALRMLLHLRMGLLFALVAVVLLRTQIDPIAFTAGLSSVVPTVLWHGWRAREP
jgi:hypothetical protein